MVSLINARNSCPFSSVFHASTLFLYRQFIITRIPSFTAFQFHWSPELCSIVRTGSAILWRWCLQIFIVTHETGGKQDDSGIERPKHKILFRNDANRTERHLKSAMFDRSRGKSVAGQGFSDGHGISDGAESKHPVLNRA